MSKRDRDTVIAALCLVLVAVLVASPAGAAIRRAMSARDASTVNGVAASLAPQPRKLVALDPSGRLPRSTVPASTAVRGPHGASGPAGPAGERGPAGEDGPGPALVLRSPESWEARVTGSRTMIVASDLDPGTYVAWVTGQARRDPGGAESLAHCIPTNGLTAGVAPGAELGAAAGGGQLQTTLMGFGVFESRGKQDIGVVCSAFNLAPFPHIYDTTLVVARVPSAWAQLGGG